MVNIRLDVARRQAFGPGFTRTARDERLANALMERKLTMPPHPEWRLPDGPNWDEDPFGDSNWQFQYHSLRWLDPLRRVAETGDTTAGRMWEKYAKSWVSNNPPGDAASPWAWVDMGDALRAMTLSFGVPIVEKNDWLLEALAEHGVWLSDEKNIGRANHSLHQHQALFILGQVLGIDHWTEIALQRLRELLLVSYDEEGVNEEGSIAYHENNYHWWQIALKRLSMEGKDLPPEAGRIELALDELAHATRPDGAYERIGDTDGGGPNRLSSPALEYMNTKGAMGIAPPEKVKVYRRGYIFGRSGWGQETRPFSDETFYSVSFGRADRVHGHQDGASMTLYAFGRPWIIDSGKFVYGNDPMRRYVLGRTGHNVVVIKNRKYDRTSQVQLLRHSISPTVDDFTLIDKGYTGVELKRRITYLRDVDCVVVSDSVLADSAVEATQMWHFESDLDVRVDATGCGATDGARSLRMAWLGTRPGLSTIRGSLDPFEGWTSTGWRKKAPNTVIKAVREGQQIDFHTVMSISSGNAEFELSKEHSTARPVIRIQVEGYTGRTFEFLEESVIAS